MANAEPEKKARRKKAGRKKKSSRQRLTEKRSEKKWGKELWRAGWTGVPSVILERQRALKLDPLDINILLQLIRHWWDAERHPFPAKDTIAQCVQRSTRTVQRRIKKLENMGLLTCNRRPGYTTVYRFDGLIRAAEPYAREAIEDRRKRARARAFTVRRAHPREAAKKAAS